MNKIVLIPGASSGYGKATAKAFKDNGDTVIMTARNLEKLEIAKNEVGGDLAFSMDVTKPSDWDLAVKTVKEKYGRLDGVIRDYDHRFVEARYDDKCKPVEKLYWYKEKSNDNNG